MTTMATVARMTTIVIIRDDDDDDDNNYDADDADVGID